jgi:hypothetical protein
MSDEQNTGESRNIGLIKPQLTQTRMIPKAGAPSIWRELLFLQSIGIDQNY